VWCSNDDPGIGKHPVVLAVIEETNDVRIELDLSADATEANI